MYRPKGFIAVLVLVLSLGGSAVACEELEELIREGIRLHDDGKFEPAAQTFKAALELDSDNDEALYRLANAYAEMGQRDLCVSTTKEGLKLEGKFEGPLFALLGSCYTADGKSASALRAYRRGLKRHPNDVSLNYNLANALATDGKNEEAIEHLETVIRGQPTHASAYYLLGKLFATDDLQVPAMYSYMSFVSLEPNGQRAVRASREVFRMLNLVGKETTGESGVPVDALVSFVQTCADSGNQETEQGFTWEHLAQQVLAMQQEGVFEPFAYVLAARAGIEGSAAWLEDNPVKFRQLNRFLAHESSSTG